eukprot:NODE_7104_length_466_cov_12.796460_g6938_i0.p1 GENE.NODE_7104_length_466_cov_12.796460_g6938_i0~~NODE_7104_length_466_cov_12.796460_g6938_i0.p1  ORF type:complete len:130 (-),score=54.29 NODE_7104_length_466_cov_12.796460_g6938_i0:23-412(-)
MQMSTVAKEDEVEVDVTWEDQKMICTFGRLNQRMQEIEAELKEKQEDIEKINDASTEIYIADDTQYVMGETFISMGVDAIEELLEREKSTLQSTSEELTAERVDIEQQMKGMKAQLYAKFGKAIYLENE